MAATGTPTPNIGLRIPLGTDPASVDDINYNSNLLDTKLGAVGSDSVQDQIDTLNGNIQQLPNTLKSSYNALIDNVQITQAETNYTTYQSRDMYNYSVIYITPIVENYIRPCVIILRSTLEAYAATGTSLNYTSGGANVEIVVKYVNRTTLQMKYNASTTKNVRIRVDGLKLE